MKNTLLFLLLFSTGIFGQSIVHSHNDYEQKAPFYLAYASGCGSIEADVYLKNGELLVAHDEKDLSVDRTLSKLYFEPIVSYQNKINEADSPLYLLIDCKSEAIGTINAIVKLIESNSILKALIFSEKLKIVISGNRPPQDKYSDYPPYILFDHQDISKELLNTEKVGIISLPFYKYSRWNGKGRLTDYDSLRLSRAIEFAHIRGKKIRFWATPDNPTAWFTLSEMGVDFINTDKPYESAAYIKTLKRSMAATVYQNSGQQYDSGINNQKGIFIVIGDGCGLAQWSSAMINSGPLNIEKIKHIGLSKTQSADDFTTDSAAGGTAIATGNKTNNRFIGKDPSGKILKSLMEISQTNNYFKGIITTDNIAGATPAAFYAHVEDRDSTYAITDFLKDSNINLIIGQAQEDQKKIISSNYNIIDSKEKKPDLKGTKNAILFDKIPFITENRGDFLGNSTRQVLDKISKDNINFIIMIENGHIDGAGHANKSTEILNEVLDLDNTIGILMEYIDKNPGCTLIVSADHETGGVTLPHADKNGNPEIRFQSDDHTGIPVPVFAYGAGAHLFSGIYENTMIFQKVLELIKNH